MNEPSQQKFASRSAKTDKNSPILEEIYRIRDEHAAEYNYDIYALGAALLQEQVDSGHIFAELPIRRKDLTV